MYGLCQEKLIQPEYLNAVCQYWTKAQCHNLQSIMCSMWHEVTSLGFELQEVGINSFRLLQGFSNEVVNHPLERCIKLKTSPNPTLKPGSLGNSSRQSHSSPCRAFHSADTCSMNKNHLFTHGRSSPWGFFIKLNPTNRHSHGILSRVAVMVGLCASMLFDAIDLDIVRSWGRIHSISSRGLQ